ncbi:PLD nuclease N-terminal domain-containing protein [Galbitalea sp. SE-J8]|uniref:PLD nuclease N-terminal domain-containing protein n=1 Tax=Galbitalea sp. SE-J8 TaxID=3054952 RepID=UPI00259C9F51|nr:PLD nuclease N-terminal domain-containing protein [Galbitalea sp. SE-J8]MDM4762407.1 PLD nuclease N-terminal domain-containing protein [Galbitalea sp. SE-J8]
MIRYVIPALVIAFTIFAFVDVLLTEDSRVRGLPKAIWAIIVIILSPIGGIIWFILGKEPAGRVAPPAAGRGGPVAPDDDPDFLYRLRMREAQDERIRQLERELADLDDDQPDGGRPDGDRPDSSR